MAVTMNNAVLYEYNSGKHLFFYMTLESIFMLLSQLI